MLIPRPIPKGAKRIHKAIAPAVYSADKAKLQMVCQALSIFAIPENVYQIERCRFDTESTDLWETITCYNKNRPDAVYQMLDCDTWVDIHLTSDCPELTRIIDNLVAKVIQRGW